MNTKRHAKLQSAAAASAPVPGLHRVYLGPTTWEDHPESFYQLGVAETAPGTLTVFHGTGMFPLATYGPGMWQRVVRLLPVVESPVATALGVESEAGSA